MTRLFLVLMILMTSLFITPSYAMDGEIDISGIESTDWISTGR